jgi:hypothetical protein
MDKHRSSFDGAGFNASGAIAHALLGDQYEQAVEYNLTSGIHHPFPQSWKGSHINAK